MRTRILLYTLLSLLFGACVENFSPEINDYLQVPIVEGIISSEPGPYVVKLTKSGSTYDLAVESITGARVVISDDLNNEETLTETGPGIYSTSATGIRGQVGRKYKVTIETEGKTYESDFAEMSEPVGIDSVYPKISYRNTSEGQVEGLQFYVNTGTYNNDGRQFLWTLNETYQYSAEYDLDFIFYTPDSSVDVRSDSVAVCWQTARIFDKFAYKSQSVNEQKLDGYPLHYIDTETNKLSVRYSVLVNQYTISDEAYHYWNEIIIQNAESGSLYTRQPYQIRGNMKNIHDNDDIVLGYFMVAGVAKKRVFIDRPALNFRYAQCYPVENLLEMDPKLLTWPLYATELPNGSLGFASMSCFDCQLQGGTIIKPDFWED